MYLVFEIQQRKTYATHSSNCDTATALRVYQLIASSIGFDEQWYYSSLQKFYEIIVHITCKLVRILCSLVRYVPINVLKNGKVIFYTQYFPCIISLFCFKYLESKCFKSDITIFRHNIF